MSGAVCPAGPQHHISMAPATAKAAVLSSSAGSSDRIPVGPAVKADEAECSDSAASSSEHLPQVNSPGYSSALAWHDDGETTDDQDETGWQLVHNKSSSRSAAGQPPSSSAPSGSSKPAVCGRCGMRGHLAARCRQPHCSRCNKWWHTEEECARACHACGSLEHRINAATPLCKSYKCRECGLYGHVYAECPNIVCNMCKQVGHKALDCPSIVCNLCKQQGHKAINCPNPRGVAQQQQQQQHGSSSAGGTAAHHHVTSSAVTSNNSSSTNRPAASKPAAGGSDIQQLQLHVLPQLRQSGSSCGSNASPTAVAADAAAGADTAAPRQAVCTSASCVVSAAGHHPPPPQQQQQQEVPLAPRSSQPASTAELQQQQQQHSQLLSQLTKAAPEVAVSLLDDSNKLQALLAIELGHLAGLLHSLAQQPPAAQHALLDSAIASAERQLMGHQQQQQQELQQHAWQPLHVAAGSAACSSSSHLERVLQHQHSSVSSNGTPASPSSASTPRSSMGAEGSDATQAIKPGDLAPQHARALQEEFGDMLPSRWQQLPSWRQLEARLSFPDGNYVQRRLQFRERRRQLQLLTLQLRASAAAAKQHQHSAGRPAGGMLRPAASKAVRVAPQVQPAASSSSSSSAAQPAVQPRPAGAAPPSSYAAALAGPSWAAAAGAGAAPAAPGSGAASQHPQQQQVPDSSAGSTAHGTGAAAAAAGAGGGSSAGLAVCRRCGMMGHTATHCAQPRCTRCHLWWHSEAQCASACQFCGSLDHQGDAEQPASCQSFRCKACKMFGHTASTCPHVQLHQHQQQELAKQRAQQLLSGQHQQASAASPAAPPSPAPPAAAASAGASSASSPAPAPTSSSSMLMSYQLALQSSCAPVGSALSLTKQGTAGSLSMASSSSTTGLDSPMRVPPDSPGLGQAGVKPKDLLPEHARALQDEFPNALPPGWQQMASWRMVEERLRVVAVEGAVFSKRRQMWRDRRKHYQALTAQALAAAARSAACDAAAAAAAATREEAVAANGLHDAQSQLVPDGEGGSAGQHDSHLLMPLDATSTAAAAGQDSQDAGAQQQQHEEVAAADPAAGHPAASSPAPLKQHTLHQADTDHLVPEWQKQGSLFGLLGSAASSLGLQMDGYGGQGAGPAGSSFSCDTASFCCSPMPAVTPSVLMSPLDDATMAAYSCTSTPLHQSAGNTACVNTPAMLGAGGLGGAAPGMAGGGSSRHGGLLQHGPLGVAAGSSPMPTMQCNTPRSAVTAAGAGGMMGPMATAPVSVPGGAGAYHPAAGGMGPMMQGGDAAAAAAAAAAPAGYPGPMHYHAGHAGGMMPRSPLSYGVPPPSPPMGPSYNAAAAASRGMPAAGMVQGGGPPPHPAMYHQHSMMVAQRQSQLQQQLMLQGGPYGPRGPAGTESPVTAQQQQQMLLTMQAQQQQAAAVQQQARLASQRQRQRADQAFLVQQAQQRQHHQQQQALLAEDFGDNGELDDKLGVLGVLGLQ